jgi:hypothetical protein
MSAPITAELIRRCERQRMGAATTAAAALCGRAVDAGVITLADVLDQVRSCSTREELDGRLLALAADVWLAGGGAA